MSWPPALVALGSQGVAPDFADHLCKLAAASTTPAWEHASTDVERGLEAWVLSFAPHGRRALASAALAAARAAYDSVIERAGDDAMECAIAEDAPCMDGDSVGMQLRRVEAWLLEDNEATRAALQRSLDPTRQLHVWEDDLRPPEDAHEISWQWFFEVGQLCLCTCLHEMQGQGEGVSYYGWPAPHCASRAVVCACKALRQSDASTNNDVRVIGAAVARAFT